METSGYVEKLSQGSKHMPPGRMHRSVHSVGSSQSNSENSAKLNYNLPSDGGTCSDAGVNTHTMRLEVRRQKDHVQVGLVSLTSASSICKDYCNWKCEDPGNITTCSNNFKFPLEPRNQIISVSASSRQLPPTLRRLVSYPAS